MKGLFTFNQVTGYVIHATPSYFVRLGFTAEILTDHSLNT